MWHGNGQSIRCRFFDNAMTDPWSEDEGGAARELASKLWASQIRWDERWDQDNESKLQLSFCTYVLMADTGYRIPGINRIVYPFTRYTLLVKWKTNEKKWGGELSTNFSHFLKWTTQHTRHTHRMKEEETAEHRGRGRRKKANILESGISGTPEK